MEMPLEPLSSYDERVLRRFNPASLSPCQTDQGPEGTCLYHAYAKLFIQNMVSVLIDLSMTPHEKSKMTACIESNPLLTSESIRNYSSKTCSEKGYWKIILFYYFFNYFKRERICFMRDEHLHLITTMAPRAAAVLPLGYSDGSYSDGTFQHLQKLITNRVKELNIRWKFMMFYYEERYQPQHEFYDKRQHDLVNRFLKRVLSLKLYCVLGTVNDAMDGHAIVMSGFHGNEFHIKNSWGDKYDVAPCKEFPVINLRGQQFTCQTIRFLFPILPTMDVPRGLYQTIEYFNDFMDSYEPIYKRWKTIGGTRKRKRKRFTINR